MNGDVKVIIERIDNLKEYIKSQLAQNNKDHEKIYDGLVKHGNSISSLKMMGMIGGSIVGVIVVVLIKQIMG